MAEWYAGLESFSISYAAKLILCIIIDATLYYIYMEDSTHMVPYRDSYQRYSTCTCSTELAKFPHNSSVRDRYGSVHLTSVVLRLFSRFKPTTQVEARLHKSRPDYIQFRVGCVSQASAILAFLFLFTSCSVTSAAIHIALQQFRRRLHGSSFRRLRVSIRIFRALDELACLQYRRPHTDP